jgi:UDP-N-acetyl-D-mannosaminuronic acid dehydrogenase
LKPGVCIIIRSTIAPRTTEYIKRTIEAEAGLIIGKDIGLAFCPERLAEHKALEELSLLPQIIGCEDNMSFRLAQEVFKPYGVKIFKTNYLSAELTKLFNNSARYVQFAIANQFALYAHSFDQDIYEILQLCNEDYPRGMINTPGFTAGTCLRKDYGMVNELFPGSDLLLSAWKVNEFMPFHLTQIAQKNAPLNGSNIAVLGYTFKANSDDSRDSLVPKLMRYLERYVPKSIKVHEPNLKEQQLGGHPNVQLADCLKEADFVFIAMNHDEYKNYKNIMKMINNETVIIDIWNCLGTNKISFKKKDV